MAKVPMAKVHGLEIRRAEAGDFEGLGALNNRLGFRLGPLPAPARNPDLYRHWLAAAQGTRLVAVQGSVIIGQAALTPPRQNVAGLVATLSIGVREDQRGQGVGGALLEALLAEADGPLSLDRIELTVFSDNHPALHLYKKFGFVLLQTRPEAVLRENRLCDVEDWIRMRL
ncbi:GNAT family N-acetyltransferase [Beijerinckia indica]|nr:GNAT family N-acetyltransferase [Beijerinckia indica]